ncbi:MAG: thioredoxin family protein [Microthrixaceae bacterium]|nr:thioredoxin family protein [Microthrixaceae bacterium]
MAFIAVAFDESPDDVAEFAEGIDLPVLLDRRHVLSETLAVSNVPTVVWIDEADRIVVPNWVAFSNDLFVEFHGVESGPGLDAIRAWVRTGEVPDDLAVDPSTIGDLSADEEAARLWFRLATELRDAGQEEAANERFLRAGALAPNDFTIRRAAMPLMGDDPFGESFFELYGQWEAAGSPYHGIRPSPSG